MPRSKEAELIALRAYYQANKERIKARVKARYLANPEPFKAYGRAHYRKPGVRARTVALRRFKRLGVTPEQYQQALQAQMGLCAICRQHQKGKELAADHEHDETWNFRGLLCDRCNRAIGLFHDDEELLKTAAEYLYRARQIASQS